MHTAIEKTAQKTPINRLLDLIRGWGSYAEDEVDEYPDTVTPDELADLYQEAGGIACEDYPDVKSEQAAVCQFVTDRILPLLNRV